MSFNSYRNNSYNSSERKSLLEIPTEYLNKKELTFTGFEILNQKKKPIKNGGLLPTPVLKSDLESDLQTYSRRQDSKSLLSDPVQKNVDNYISSNLNNNNTFGNQFKEKKSRFSDTLPSVQFEDTNKRKIESTNNFPSNRLPDKQIKKSRFQDYIPISDYESKKQNELESINDIYYNPKDTLVKNDHNLNSNLVNTAFKKCYQDKQQTKTLNTPDSFSRVSNNDAILSGLSTRNFNTNFRNLSEISSKDANDMNIQKIFSTNIQQSSNHNNIFKNINFENISDKKNTYSAIERDDYTSRFKNSLTTDKQFNNLLNNYKSIDFGKEKDVGLKNTFIPGICEAYDSENDISSSVTNNKNDHIYKLKKDQKDRIFELFKKCKERAKNSTPPKKAVNLESQAVTNEFMLNENYQLDSSSNNPVDSKDSNYDNWFFGLSNNLNSIEDLNSLSLAEIVKLFDQTIEKLIEPNSSTASKMLSTEELEIMKKVQSQVKKATADKFKSPSYEEPSRPFSKVSPFSINMDHDKPYIADSFEDEKKHAFTECADKSTLSSGHFNKESRKTYYSNSTASTKEIKPGNDADNTSYKSHNVYKTSSYNKNNGRRYFRDNNRGKSLVNNRRHPTYNSNKYNNNMKISSDEGLLDNPYIQPNNTFNNYQNTNSNICTNLNATNNLYNNAQVNLLQTNLSLQLLASKLQTNLLGSLDLSSQQRRF